MWSHTLTFLIGLSFSLFSFFCPKMNTHCSIVIGWQSYVLDVHPFNPRIAMSAGYDGRTIVWDVSFFSYRFLNPE
jgi:hypothetical protein